MRLLLCGLLALWLSVGQAGPTINANTAPVEVLQTVTGIGPTLAQRIVAERRNGPYKSLDDLQARVRGIGETSIRKMRAAGLTVSGGASATTARP